MKKIILMFIVLLGLSNISYAEETTGTIETGVSTSGLEFNIPCSPVSVSNGTVNATTCVITCNNGYVLSGDSCVAESSSSSSSSGGGGGGGGGGSSTSTCLSSQLECREYLDGYVWFKKDGVSCKGGKLGEACEISSGTGTTDGTGTVIDSSDDISEDMILEEDTDNIDDGNDSIDDSTDSGDNDLLSDNDTVGSSGFNLNGDNFTLEVDEETKTVIIKKEDDGEEVIFHDIFDTFAKNYIVKLASLGIINGYEDETFKPEQQATRGEYLKMILLANNVDYSEVDVSNLKFLDVDKNSWVAKVVAKAVELGIIDGNNLYFRPDDFISRAESMKMLIIAFGYQVNENVTSDFVDVSGWATKYIVKAKELGIVNGQLIDGVLKFRPEDNITRAEVAKIIVKIMELY